MGRPMAAKPGEAGTKSRYGIARPENRSMARVRRLSRHAANGAEVVWMCVSTRKAVEACCSGARVESTSVFGAIVVDSSTISPSAERQLPNVCAQRRRLRGCSRYGFEVAAGKRKPDFMVRGDEARARQTRSALQAMGQASVPHGRDQQGQAAKLVMNLQIALIYEVIAEALTLPRSWA